MGSCGGHTGSLSKCPKPDNSRRTAGLAQRLSSPQSPKPGETSEAHARTPAVGTLPEPAQVVGCHRSRGGRCARMSRPARSSQNRFLRQAAMTLDELLNRISEDRSSESEVTSVLREHLGRHGYVDKKLRTALIAAGIHNSPEKWDRYG